MPIEAWIALGTTVAVLAALASNRAPPDLALLGGALLLVATGVLEPAVALRGFSNEGMLTVAVLFVVARAMQRTGAMALIAGPLLGNPRTTRGAIARLTLTASTISGFINNTPLVAMLLPQVATWSRQLRISPSKLLMPLSFASVLGGMLTMIGTSTNLVVAGLLIQAGRGQLGFFAPTALGAIVALVGLVVLFAIGPWLLPDRIGAGAFSDPRRFTVEVTVESNGPFADRDLSALKAATGLNPIEIVRRKEIIAAPGPDVIVRSRDRLVLAGPAVSIAGLGRIPGLAPAPDHLFGSGGGRHLFEVIVSDQSPLVGEKVGTGVFRRRYGGAIVAVARHGETVAGIRQADWELRPGDALLVEASSNFLDHPDLDREFWTLSEPEGVKRAVTWRTWSALGVTTTMCALAATGLVPMLWAGMAAAVVIVAGGILRGRDARTSIDIQILVAIASSFAIGSALESSGAAAVLARTIVAAGANHPWLTLLLVYLATAVTTEVITNNAAAALLLPIALATADALGVAWMPFAMAVMFAASSSFMTPIGYATNLMVWGPGGYAFGDFVRLGGLIWVCVAATSVALIPVFWPFVG